MQRIGLIGYPLTHSISPAFQQAALDAAGIQARYEAWEAPDSQLGELATRLRRADILGANVTIPHKRAVMAYLDEIDPAAQAIGAVNTILRQGQRLIGYNTDVPGFARAIRDDGGDQFQNRRIGVLGAGGAARAVVAAAMAGEAAEIRIAARRIEQAGELLDDLAALKGNVATRALALGTASAELAACDILVNTTPIGMAHRPDAEVSPLAPEWIRPTMLVCDLIYNPPSTPLLRAAKDRGARILNGLPMLIYQGAAAWELWIGQPAPVEVMRRAAREALSRR